MQEVDGSIPSSSTIAAAVFAAGLAAGFATGFAAGLAAGFVAQAPGLGFQLAAGAQGGLEVLHAFLEALLNVIADAKTKVYGDADPSLTYQVSVHWNHFTRN